MSSDDLIRNQSQTGIGGYSFLSSNAMLTVLHARNEDYSDHSLSYTTEIDIFRIDALSTHLRLELPLTSSPTRVRVTSSSPPRECINQPDGLYISPFMHDEDAERIVVIALLGQHLFVSVRKLLRLLQEAADASSGTPKVRYSWDEWGPDATFWMPFPNLFSGWISVDGARFAGIHLMEDFFDTDEDGCVVSTKLNLPQHDTVATRTYILVLDFNPLPIARIKARREAEGTADTMVKEWRWSLPHFQREPVISRLPFRAFQRASRSPINTLMVDMNHLVAVGDQQEEVRSRYHPRFQPSLKPF